MITLSYNSNDNDTFIATGYSRFFLIIFLPMNVWMNNNWMCILFLYYIILFRVMWFFFFFFFEDNTYPHSNPFNLYLFYIELKAILSFYNAFCKDKKLFDHKYSRKGGDKKKKKKSNNNAILTSHVIKNKFNNILWLVYNKNNINIQYFEIV